MMKKLAIGKAAIRIVFKTFASQLTIVFLTWGRVSFSGSFPGKAFQSSVTKQKSVEVMCNMKLFGQLSVPSVSCPTLRNNIRTIIALDKLSKHFRHG